MQVTRSMLKMSALVVLMALLASACSSTSSVIGPDSDVEVSDAEALELSADNPAPDATSVAEPAPSPSETPTATAANEAPSPLANIALGSTTAEALDRVALVGLPDDTEIGDVQVFYLVGEDGIGADVAVDDEGPYFLAPLHPDTPGQGGPLDVRVAIGDELSRKLSLDLTPLAAAPGTTVAIVAELRDQAEAHAVSVGTTLAELEQQEFDQVAPEHLIIKAIQLLLDGDPSSDSSAGLLDDIAALSDADLAIVDSAMAKIEAAPTGPDGTPPPPPPPPLPAGPPAPPSTHEASADGSQSADTATSVRQAATTSATAGTAADCISDPPTIRTPEELQRAITIGTDAKRELAGATTRVRQHLQAVAGLFGPAGAAAAVVLTTKSLFLAVDGSRYPSELSALTPTPSTTTFNEDFKDPGSWGSISVTATSRGSELLDELVTSLLALAGGTIGTGIGAIDGTDGAVFSIETTVLDNGVLFENPVVTLLRELGATVRYCPHSWTVKLVKPGTNETATYVDVNAPDNRLSVDQIEQTFVPTRLGDALLVFRLKQKDFGHLEVTASVPIETLQTSVLLQPDRIIRVDAPGEVVEIELSFLHSDSQSVTWDTDGGAFVDGFGDEAGETTRELQTVTSESEFPMTVAARLNTKQGLFANGQPLPADSISIVLSELIVTPKDASLSPGDTLQYQATNRDGDSVDVTWQASGGSIDDEGLYTAGDEPGTYNVTANLVADPAISTTVPVTIVDATCLVGTWQLRLDEMAEQLSQFTPDGSFLFVSGEYIVTIFADDTWTAQRRELNFEIMAQGQTGLMIINSAEAGIVEIDEGRISIIETSSDATAFLEFPGIGRIGGAVPAGGGFAGSGTFTCGDDVLTVSADGFTATFDYLGPAT